MIKYLGSKRTLIPTICEIVKGLPNVNSTVDLFSGTSRVGHAFKKEGYQVFSNDHNSYAATLARCYVQTNREDVQEEVERYIKEFNQMEGKSGYFTENFCEKARFFQPHNGIRVDAIRERIEEEELSPEVKSVLLVSLMEAADRVDSTTGVQMAYLKKWAGRAYNKMELRIPNLLCEPNNGKCQAYQLDAFEAAKVLRADLAYLDPPYNQHKYLGNYHIWETLVRWDKPEVYGIARKRIDVRERKSEFNSKKMAVEQFGRVIEAIDSTYLVVSFSDEGYISRSAMEGILNKRGEVLVIEKDYKRYVGAQIGVHSPAGIKVGEVSHLRNKEYIYVVAPNSDLLQGLAGNG
jgi:adenine-specific DNA-methyltransferase